MAMTAGPMTDMSPTPMPSMMRLTISTAVFSNARPMREPPMAQAKAMIPPRFGPILFRMTAAGIAITMPTSEKTELSHPAVAISIWSASCRTSMHGATLFCTRARAIPAKIVAKATIQAFFVFIANLTSEPFPLPHEAAGAGSCKRILYAPCSALGTTPSE